MSHLERETPGERSQRMAGKRFLGMVLMAAGGLLALLCGLCTLAISVAFIANGTRAMAAEQLSVLLVPLIVGGVPTAAGVTLFWFGLKIYREGRKRRDPPEGVFD